MSFAEVVETERWNKDRRFSTPGRAAGAPSPQGKITGSCPRAPSAVENRRSVPPPSSLSRDSILSGIVFFLSLASLAVRAETTIEDVAGQAFFSFEYERATDFSGITWAGGSDYYAVSDKVKGIFPLRISIEPSSGRILDAEFRPMLPVKTKLADFEGIAFVPKTRRLYVSAEAGNGIFGFDIARGVTFPVAVPPVFEHARNNKSLESLTFDATVGNFWTANEEALQGDGPVSGPERGTMVRLQKLDRRFKPVAQFAYCTECSGIRLYGGGTGVSDLALLPNGELLVLERVAGFLGISAEIFRAETRGVTDVSRIPRLDGADFKPAAKKLLFQRATLTNNFEGIALGPKLTSGWRSLILIADSGGGTTHYLMPLRIRMEAVK